MKKSKEDKSITDNPPKAQLENFSKGYVTLPVDEEHFKSFIVGLLGKPQTIAKSITGNFEIHLKDIQNFHDLISQRIVQQNKGRLIQFRTKIYFSDQSSVELGSYEELTTYNQIKPIVSDAVKLSWSYLIQFADKDAPEKQEIEILIISTSERPTILGRDIPIIIADEGEFRITIQHTARTWGDDMESLLSNQINSIIIKENLFKKFIREKSSIISLSVAILFVLGSIIGAFIVTNGFYQTELNKVCSFNQKTIDTTAKINFLTEYIASGIVTKHYFKISIFLLASIIISIFLGVWVDNLAETRTHSYIILTRESLKKAEKMKEKLKRKWFWFFGSILISIIAGVIANYIFRYFAG